MAILGNQATGSAIRYVPLLDGYTNVKRPLCNPKRPKLYQ